MVPMSKKPEISFSCFGLNLAKGKSSVDKLVLHPQSPSVTSTPFTEQLKKAPVRSCENNSDVIKAPVGEIQWLKADRYSHSARVRVNITLLGRWWTEEGSKTPPLCDCATPTKKKAGHPGDQLLFAKLLKVSVFSLYRRFIFH